MATGRRSFALLAGGLLAGCGFRPLYAPGPGGTAGPAQQELAAIYVALMPDRSGQVMRQALQERFEGAGFDVPKRYELSALFSAAPESIAIQRSNASTRVRLIGTAVWTLRDLTADRRVVANGTARSVDGYNVLNQQFFALDLENESTVRQVAAALADQVTLQLASFFASRARP